MGYELKSISQLTQCRNDYLSAINATNINTALSVIGNELKSTPDYSRLIATLTESNDYKSNISKNIVSVETYPDKPIFFRAVSCYNALSIEASDGNTSYKVALSDLITPLTLSLMFLSAVIGKFVTYDDIKELFIPWDLTTTKKTARGTLRLSSGGADYALSVVDGNLAVHDVLTTYANDKKLNVQNANILTSLYANALCAGVNSTNKVGDIDTVTSYKLSIDATHDAAISTTALSSTILTSDTGNISAGNFTNLTAAYLIANALSAGFNGVASNISVYKLSANDVNNDAISALSISCNAFSAVTGTATTGNFTDLTATLLTANALSAGKNNDTGTAYKLSVNAINNGTISATALSSTILTSDTGNISAGNFTNLTAALLTANALSAGKNDNDGTAYKLSVNAVNNGEISATALSSTILKTLTGYILTGNFTNLTAALLTTDTFRAGKLTTGGMTSYVLSLDGAENNKFTDISGNSISVNLLCAYGGAYGAVISGTAISAVELTAGIPDVGTPNLVVPNSGRINIDELSAHGLSAGNDAILKIGKTDDKIIINNLSAVNFCAGNGTIENTMGSDAILVIKTGDTIKVADLSAAAFQAGKDSLLNIPADADTITINKLVANYLSSHSSTADLTAKCACWA